MDNSTSASAARSRARVLAEEHALLCIALLVAFVFHGGMLLQGSYQRTYDAWVHIFFADHYRRWWWSSWDPRWYTGFTTVSYPPGTHQTIALLSKALGLRTGFVTVQFLAIVNLIVGTYRWARLWVTEREAGWAAVLVALSPAIAETVHVFGQLPTTFSLGFLLQSLPFAHRWIKTGSFSSLVAGVGCTAACTAGHHVTTLFGSVFFLGPVLVAALVEQLRSPVPDEGPSRRVSVTLRTLVPLAARRVRRVQGALVRAAAYGVLVILALVIVVLPYWLWSSSDPITQISIPHASRDSFLVNRNAGLVFFIVPWGLALLALPYSVVRGIRSKAWPLALSLLGLAFLGTGGTTPFPKLLLGGAYEILTLDRFTFWATICILPLLGRLVVSIIDGNMARLLRLLVGQRLSTAMRAFGAVAFVLFTLFAANLTHFRKFQPAMIDPMPVKSFMEKDEHWRWRYLLLGFGDQMAWTSAQMTAQTVDGNYHSARRLPELTSRPVERLEGAKYSGVPGIGSLQQFLSVPSRYSLKFVFSKDEFYDPLLHFTGWHQLSTLDNGVVVWEKSDVAPLVGDTVDHQIPGWQRWMWGVLPMTAIISALTLLLWASLGQPLPARVSRVMRRLRGLIRRSPVGRVAAWSDARLRACAAQLDHHPAAAPQPERVERRLDQFLSQTSRRTTQVLSVALMLAAVGLVAGPVVVRHVEPRGPADVVADYYDHLDFRRFPAAYDTLDPETRPTFEEFSIDQSVDGGLVSSYSKMAHITTTIVDRAGAEATVRADIAYVTSLARYPVTTYVRTVMRGGTWRVRAPTADLRQPVDQITSRPQVAYLQNLQAAIRTIDGSTTARPDILDRPRLWLSNVRTLRRGDQWMVVGRVVNIDVDPADVTVTAQLRDRSTKLLATYDAAQVTIHKLLPGQGSPFRIDFESIAGTTAANAAALGDKATEANIKPVAPRAARNVGPIEFDPTVITPLELPDGVQPASTDVFARAVVSGREATRGLQVTDLRVERNGDGSSSLVGTLRNDATIEASVPMLLVSYTDSQGDIAWVESHYLEHSIRPQWSQPFRIPLANGAGLRRADIPTVGHADDIGASTGLRRGPGPMLELPSDSPYAGVTIDATAFSREGGGL